MPENQNSADKTYIEKLEHVIFKEFKGKIRHTILVVDDEDDNLQLLNRTLRKDYDVLTASNGQEALKIVEEKGKDIALILSDERMPNMSGTEFLSQLQEKYPDIIKILLTGYTDIDAMISGINNCRLFQYITKPFDLEDLKSIVKDGIKAYELNIINNELLEDLGELFFTTVKSISSALDAKDKYTNGHSHRVTIYSLIIAKELNLEESMLQEIEIAGLLHDIGKIGIPEKILHKPTKLTEEEFQIMRMHPELGKKMLAGINKLYEVANWVSGHHERWDGKGYPLGLKGEEIPLPARILAIADTYDAMTTNRSYRGSLTHDFAVDEIGKHAGIQFDPNVVDVLIKLKDTFKELSSNKNANYYDKYSVLNKYFKKKI